MFCFAGHCSFVRKMYVGTLLFGAFRDAVSVLLIEVETATKLMPKFDKKSIYQLKVQARTWSLDGAGNVKVLRYGFPVVPDFGGTAHAYCGTTLEACIGDLLPWHATPNREAALRAYIIKSRIKKAENLLLGQPYSPMLFSQGNLAGPKLLLDVMLGKLTFKEVKQE